MSRTTTYRAGARVSHALFAFTPSPSRSGRALGRALLAGAAALLTAGTAAAQSSAWDWSSSARQPAPSAAQSRPAPDAPSPSSALVVIQGEDDADGGEAAEGEAAASVPEDGEVANAISGIMAPNTPEAMRSNAAELEALRRRAQTGRPVVPR